MINDTTHTSRRERILKFLSRLVRPRTHGAVSLGKTRSHGFIAAAVARTSVGVMTQRVGISAETLANNPSLHDDLVRACTTCTEQERCRDWLAQPHGGPDEFKSFCVNADRFQQMGVDK